VRNCDATEVSQRPILSDGANLETIGLPQGANRVTSLRRDAALPLVARVCSVVASCPWPIKLMQAPLFTFDCGGAELLGNNSQRELFSSISAVRLATASYGRPHQPAALLNVG
jgi:hypothetical protein